MRLIKYFLYAVLVVIVALNVVYVSHWYYNNTRLDTDSASEIKELQAVQDQWVEQVELLIVIDRLSFNLQCAELDKKELFNSLGDAVKTNNELRLLVRQLMNQQYSPPPDFDLNPSRST